MRITKRVRNLALFFSTTIILSLFLSPAQGKEPLDGWERLNHRDSVSLSRGSTPELTWNFAYNSEPSVLKRSATSMWKNASGVTCLVRSDRDGQLFLRIDQNNEKTFLTHFPVSKKWEQRHLPFDQFIPFGKTTGNIEPPRIKNIYLVDLNGADSGAKGKRTISIKNLTISVSVATTQRETIEIPLVAFDSNGKVLDLKDFKARGTSGGRWCYLSDSTGDSIPMKIVEQSLQIDGKRKKVPTIIVNKHQPAFLEMLYWTLNDKYKVRLQADGSGKGIQSLNSRGFLLVNLELALTRFQSLSDYTGGSKGLFAADLKKIKAELTRIAQEPNLSWLAKQADTQLVKLLDLSQKAVRLKSSRELMRMLTPHKEISLPTPNPNLLKAGSRVTINLVDPAFRIGIGQGFGFVTNKVPAKQVDRYYKQLRQAGFNMVTLPLYWDKVVDNRGRETNWQKTLRFETLATLGYSLHAHGFVQSGMPAAAHKLKGNNFLSVAKQHTTNLAAKLIQRYGEQIVLWQAINEPASYRFGDSSVKSRIDMVAELIKHMRHTIPNAKIVVNDYDWERGIEAGKPLSSRSIIGTLPFFREMLKKEHKPDVLAIEWYPGARVERPEFRVNLSEPCMDMLDTSRYWDRVLELGLPLIFTESNFPGTMRAEDKNGYAWGRWNSESQAQAAVDTLILAMSKPDIWGWVWWSITDREPWNREGGLYTAKGEEKPVLNRLVKKIKALKKEHQVTVRTDGKLAFPTLPGIWRISVEKGSSWMVEYNREGNVYMVQEAVF